MIQRIPSYFNSALSSLTGHPQNFGLAMAASFMTEVSLPSLSTKTQQESCSVINGRLASTKNDFFSSVSQKDALRAASESTHYYVELLEKIVDGQRKKIVLLGESHIKFDDDQARLGEDIVNEFSTVFYEKVGEMNLATFDRFYLSALQLISQGMNQFVSKTASFLFPRSQNIKKLLELTGSTIGYAQKMKPKNQMFPLEQGHSPSPQLRDDLIQMQKSKCLNFLFYPPAILGFYIYCLSTCESLFALPSHIRSKIDLFDQTYGPLLTSASSFVSGSAGIKSGGAANEKEQQQIKIKAAKALMQNERTIITERNAHWAERLNELLPNLDDEISIAIMGRAHVPGLSQLLQSPEYGFQLSQNTGLDDLRNTQEIFPGLIKNLEELEDLANQELEPVKDF